MHVVEIGGEPRTETVRTPKLVGVVWTLLVVNTLGSIGVVTIVRIPRSIIQLVTMGSLVVAFALALALNHRVRIRPNAYLLLLTLLLVTSVISSAQLESGYGAFFRCFRLFLFISTLWLLTRWWDGTLTFVHYHIRVLVVVLMSVLAGLVISPGKAMPEFYSGRLLDAIWPLTPPQVAHYAAICVGLTLMLWLGRRTDRTNALVVAVPALGVLFLSHTRTATLGLVVGMTVALLSLSLTNARARKVFAFSALSAGAVAVFAGGLVLAWFQRGQSQESLSNLTGRAKVWDALLEAPRTTMENLFGIGLGDKSFGGLPIDSSWLAVFHEEGYVGVVIVAAFLLILLTVAVLRPPSLSRACAIFLIVYCLTASYTEAGLGDASPYLLDLAMAGSLLAQGETS
ncbi:MAG TPA: O-antigen ligase domain-containing protein [Amycolatopsis sp.]|uniref:O-antigen ligase family protein n=1 Tax=Amycolatopsis sp. TaxID=37632 RepID=UPI002B45CDA6|nr:O-antigen ligase domain-containing protein [Amycolatopsis sp.]HKS47422.1 O-antigen ligase domain-containing protein [Amycolatopsis sp.]